MKQIYLMKPSVLYYNVINNKNYKTLNVLENRGNFVDFIMWER
jgi:hypothetical protein